MNKFVRLVVFAFAYSTASNAFATVGLLETVAMKLAVERGTSSVAMAETIRSSEGLQTWLVQKLTISVLTLEVLEPQIILGQGVPAALIKANTFAELEGLSPDVTTLIYRNIDSMKWDVILNSLLEENFLSDTNVDSEIASIRSDVEEGQEPKVLIDHDASKLTITREDHFEFRQRLGLPTIDAPDSSDWNDRTNLKDEIFARLNKYIGSASPEEMLLIAELPMIEKAMMASKFEIGALILKNGKVIRTSFLEHAAIKMAAVNSTNATAMLKALEANSLAQDLLFHSTASAVFQLEMVQPFYWRMHRQDSDILTFAKSFADLDGSHGLSEGGGNIMHTRLESVKWEPILEFLVGVGFRPDTPTDPEITSLSVNDGFPMEEQYRISVGLNEFLVQASPAEQARIAKLPFHQLAILLDQFENGEVILKNGKAITTNLEINSSGVVQSQEALRARVSERRPPRHSFVPENLSALTRIQVPPLRMIKMSEIGYNKNDEVTIQVSWGTQTKPPGQDAFMSLDISDKNYFILSVDSNGNPAGYKPSR